MSDENGQGVPIVGNLPILSSACEWRWEVHPIGRDNTSSEKVFLFRLIMPTGVTELMGSGRVHPRHGERLVAAGAGLHITGEMPPSASVRICSERVRTLIFGTPSVSRKGETLNPRISAGRGATVAVMKTETAMGFAASEAGITTDQAEAVVRTYLASLSMCPACEGEGNVAWRYDASIDLQGGTKTIPAGTRTPCPNCGGMATGRGLDPANVVWVCLLGTGRSDCSRAKQEMDPTHSHCGFRLALDIPEAPQ